MITTRYGSEVEVLGQQDKDGFIEVRRRSDGVLRSFHVTELRADTQEELQKIYKHSEND